MNFIQVNAKQKPIQYTNSCAVTIAVHTETKSFIFGVMLNVTATAAQLLLEQVVFKSSTLPDHAVK